MADKKIFSNLKVLIGFEKLNKMKRTLYLQSSTYYIRPISIIFRPISTEL